MTIAIACVLKGCPDAKLKTVPLRQSPEAIGNASGLPAIEHLSWHPKPRPLPKALRAIRPFFYPFSPMTNYTGRAFRTAMTVDAYSGMGIVHGRPSRTSNANSW